MNFSFVLAVFCAVACADAFRVVRSDGAELVELSTNSTATECCYPRPPRKRNMKRCCEIPLDDIYDNLHVEIKQCKEEMKKKKDEQATEKIEELPTTPSTPFTQPPKEMEEADLVDLEDASSNEVEDSSPSTEASPTTGKGRELHGRHHNGKWHGKKGKGKCVKSIMEKRGWAKEGIVNYDAILKDTQKAAKPEAEQWIPILREAINNCSKQPLPELQNEEKLHYIPEKAALRCIKNNAMMSCPDFPETDEYCVQLREVYQRCGARKQFGRRRFEWCEGKKQKTPIIA